MTEPSELTLTTEITSQATRMSQAARMSQASGMLQAAGMPKMMKTTTTTTEFTVALQTAADTGDQLEGPVQPADSGDMVVQNDEGTTTGGEMCVAWLEEREEQEIQLQDMPDLEMLLEDEKFEWVFLLCLVPTVCLTF